ncbi:MAG TPA: hypothetical protein VGO17_09285, partial [Aurantimonas sp.]|nr:hypothetical protein [Aurantimonas sp.]
MPAGEGKTLATGQRDRQCRHDLDPERRFLDRRLECRKARYGLFREFRQVAPDDDTRHRRPDRRLDRIEVTVGEIVRQSDQEVARTEG